MRNLKALGIALVAVFAMSALAASSASAVVKHHFDSTSTTENTWVTGEDHEGANKFITPAGAITCKEVHYYGTQAGNTVTAVTVTPKYGECTSPVGPVTVTNEGCQYLLTGETDENGHAQVHMECGEKGRIHLTFQEIKCDQELKSQTLSGVHYTNAETPGKPHEVTLHNTFKNIHYTNVSTGFGGCFLLGGAGTFANAEYIGTVTVRGYQDDGPTKPTGPQVGVKVKENVT